MARDNFTAKTVSVLGERVGFICSNPDCRVHTVGPNTQSDKSTRVGEAAHITAAAAGGPRYDASLTDAQRRSINNGIWLCSNCSDLIDKDEAKYSTILLYKWKADAEFAMSQAIKAAPVSSSSGTIEYSPFLEMDLIWAHGGRRPLGYSSKTPTEEHEGRQVIIAGSENIIMFWELDWHFTIAIYNNSKFNAYNIKIEQLSEIGLTSLGKLPKVNNLPSLQNIELEATYVTRFEGTYKQADAIILDKVPSELNGSILKISYMDEARNEHTTIVTINNQGVDNNKG